MMVCSTLHDLHRRYSMPYPSNVHLHILALVARSLTDHDSANPNQHTAATHLPTVHQYIQRNHSRFTCTENIEP